MVLQISSGAQLCISLQVQARRRSMNSQARCSPGVLNCLGQLKTHSATYLSYLELFTKFIKLISYKTWNALQCDRAQLCFWSIRVTAEECSSQKLMPIGISPARDLETQKTSDRCMSQGLQRSFGDHDQRLNCLASYIASWLSFSKWRQQNAIVK